MQAGNFGYLYRKRTTLVNDPRSLPQSQPLPSGTLTFFFTDIEGSTRLWELYPDPMRLAMIRHDALIESLVEQYQGAIVRPRGEGIAALLSLPILFMQSALPTRSSTPFITSHGACRPL